ncbi:hypothetical protein [Comamonas testosteroni]|uniref:hypothetical protein n=1 Tax=Comamonas testosteroni TaxID=285 RepID=UPI0005B2FC11|nr:hypothetical protein [Comamonas testosteroni]
MHKLYTVYQNGDRAYGLETLGPQRHVIQVNGNKLESEQTVALEALATFIGGLMRQGYLPSISGSYFSSKNGFQQCHPDFDMCEGKYSVFIAPPDITAAVSELQALGDTSVFDASMRREFMDWLRSLDMNETYIVAPKENPAFTILLAEVAIKGNLILHGASVGMPAERPSGSLNKWASWLSTPQVKLNAMFPMFKASSNSQMSIQAPGTHSDDWELDLFE